MLVVVETICRETMKNGLQKKNFDEPSCDVYFCVFRLFFKEVTLKMLFQPLFPSLLENAFLQRIENYFKVIFLSPQFSPRNCQMVKTKRRFLCSFYAILCSLYKCLFQKKSLTNFIYFAWSRFLCNKFSFFCTYSAKKKEN